MKRELIAMGVAALLAGGVAGAAEDPGTGIVGSPHDFTNPTGQAYQADPHASICIFCHIQHRPGNSAPTTGSTRLLWNHKLSTQSFS